jgi:hypothetical protein
MTALQEQYVTDHEGNRIGVFLDLKQYQQILEDLEEFDDIRAYDAAKASGDEAIPLAQAVAEIQQKHTIYRRWYMP